MTHRLIAGLLILASAGAAARDNAPVRVFDAGELPPHRYEVIERLWTGTWWASFRIPEHNDSADALAALTGKAARLGADGVVNVHCLKDGDAWGGGYYCYGLAVKLK